MSKKGLTAPSEGRWDSAPGACAELASHQNPLYGGRISSFLWGTNLSSLAVPEAQDGVQGGAQGYGSPPPQLKQSFLIGSGMGT